LVNYGQEQGKYLLDLAHQIQKSIQQRFGIDLEIEVNLIS
jgi:UDP-N-acetylenolpyruvoylglucosamine reductase